MGLNATILFHLALLAGGDVALLVQVENETQRGFDAALATLHSQASATGLTVVPPKSLHQRLWGFDERESPEMDALRAKLTTAIEMEANFNNKGANALRNEVLAAYEQSKEFSPELLAVAAQALQDLAASYWAEGERQKAVQAAQEALRRFPSSKLNPIRHPPGLHAFFDEVRQGFSRQLLEQVTVRADETGFIVIDAAVQADIDNTLEVSLAPGSYKVWWRSQDQQETLGGMLVEVGDEPLEVVVDSALLRRIHIADGQTMLICPHDCSLELQALVNRADLQQAWAVHATAVPMEQWTVVEARADAIVRRNLIASEVAFSKFSAWYLLPLGGGQFAQKRPIFGSAYLAAQLGLGAWHISNVVQHQQAIQRGNFQREFSLRKRRNVSSAVFFSVMAASVLEAVVVGLIWGE